VKESQSRFWTFSLTVYGAPAVQEECLDLQDGHGVDVNMLLFCAFVGAVHCARLPDQDMRAAVTEVGKWNQSVVSSLRDARRALKRFAANDASAEALRNSVKAAELEAERIEQAMLESWCAARIEGWPRSRPIDAVKANVGSLLALCGGSVRPPPIPDHLIAAALAAARPAGD
jgi:uncharacterized protein (TIGR02444 family)